MDINRLYNDFDVPVAGEENRHYRAGWVNTACPYCTGNPGHHLGYNKQGEYFYCWRCGWHPVVETLSFLLNVSIRDVRGIIRGYGTLFNEFSEKKSEKVPKKEHVLPSNVMPLQNNHIKYLEKRKFDAKQIERDWHVMGTGTYSKLDNINFKHRLVVPIIWNNQQVSFQTRDITDKHRLKYITCPKDRELIEHKHILYGKQETWRGSGICCEGITDVWRLGSKSFCTFGIQYTQRQIREISRHFKRVAVVFDEDPQAQEQASKLVAELKFRKVDAFNVEIAGDPASLDQDDAEYLIKNLI